MIVDIDLISLLLISSFVQGMKLWRFYFFLLVVVVEISSAVQCIISLWESLVRLKGIGTISLLYEVVGCVIEILYATLERWLSSEGTGGSSRGPCDFKGVSPVSLWHLNTESPVGGLLLLGLHHHGL